MDFLWNGCPWHRRSWAIERDTRRIADFACNAVSVLRERVDLQLRKSIQIRSNRLDFGLDDSRQWLEAFVRFNALRNRKEQKPRKRKGDSIDTLSTRYFRKKTRGKNKQNKNKRKMNPTESSIHKK